MKQRFYHLRRRLGAFTLTPLAMMLVAACGGGDNNPAESQPSVDSPRWEGTVDREQTDEHLDEWSPQYTELPQVLLADDGQSHLPIVIGTNSDPSMVLAAEELADYLERISGAPFDVLKETDGAHGIIVGTIDDFDSPPLGDVTFGDGIFEMEDYVIRSTDDSLYLLGSTPLAVRFAVWDLLYQFGHRQFFPTETWEVVPTRETLEVAVDVYERPDYYSRQAPRGAMRMDVRPWAYEAWENWRIRNRTTPTFSLSTGHVYDSVIAENQSSFDQNPDYWGSINGERNGDAQPNVANEDVQQMFIDHALEQFERDPERHSVAMDPRDGNYWSDSAESLAIGGPSEQAVFLANRVAEAVVQEYGDDKFVGMYGYSHHSPPPEIDVHPNVIVSLATEYIRGGYTFDEMIDGWSERANMIGIREYYGLWEWHYSLPGNGAHAANTKYLQETIPYFHERGARFINAESNDTWGAYGLGYYLASRMMWDVDEAQRMDELIDDFLTKAFGPAKEPMAEFYALIDGSASDPNLPERSRPLNDDMVGRMYRLLNEARQMAADDDAVRSRIDDLILYTHYVELYRRFDSIDGPKRQQAFDDLVSFAWRSRHTMMAESVELTRYINRRVRTDDHLEWGPGYDRNGPADHHRQGEDEPFSEAEVREILDRGIDNHELVDLDFEPWVDSGVLEPANLPADEPGKPIEQVNRGSVEAFMATDDGILPAFTISSGHIFDDRGPMQWELVDEDGHLIDHGEVVPNEEDHHFQLSAPEPGVYRFSLNNASQGFIWDYEPRGAMMTLLAGGEHQLQRNWYNRLYYYVPKGTEDIYIAGTLMEERHEFIDGDGEPIDPDAIEVIQDYTRVPVPHGQDGAVWSLELRAMRPNIRFLNIPGYVALSPDELLLPPEVIDEL